MDGGAVRVVGGTARVVNRDGTRQTPRAVLEEPGTCVSGFVHDEVRTGDGSDVEVDISVAPGAAAHHGVGREHRRGDRVGLAPARGARPDVEVARTYVLRLGVPVEDRHVDAEIKARIAVDERVRGNTAH